MIKDSNTNTRQGSDKTAIYDEAIRRHYDWVAETEKDQATSTMADILIRKKETKFIIDTTRHFISSRKNEHSASGGYASGSGRTGSFSLMDVGCGNGFTLEALHSVSESLTLVGMELNDSLRQIAIKRLSAKKIHIFKGDIRDVQSFPSRKFDILVCQRVIINLLDNSHQNSALHNLINCVNEGGILIFIEAFNTGLANLNNAREEFGLSALPPAHHNLYLDDDFFNDKSIEIFDASFKESLSSHYFISRVIHEALLKASNRPFKRNSHFVNFFSSTIQENVGEFAPLKMLAFKKLASPHNAD